MYATRYGVWLTLIDTLQVNWFENIDVVVTLITRLLKRFYECELYIEKLYLTRTESGHF